MASRDIGRACVDIFAIHLIAEQIEVVFLHEVANLVHLTASVEVAGWVVGVANHDGTSALVDELLEFRNGKSHIVGVSGFGDDDFITRVQTTHESEKHRFASSRGDNDVVGRYVDVVFLVVAHQFLAIAQITLAGGIFQHFAVHIL